MESIKLIKSDYLNSTDKHSAHFIGTISSVKILTSGDLEIRFVETHKLNRHPIFAVTNSVICCILPNKIAPSQNLVRWLGDSLPVYPDGSIHLEDLEKAKVIVSVKPRYVKTFRRYDTKLENLIVLSLNH